MSEIVVMKALLKVKRSNLNVKNKIVNQKVVFLILMVQFFTNFSWVMHSGYNDWPDGGALIQLKKLF